MARGLLASLAAFALVGFVTGCGGATVPDIGPGAGNDGGSGSSDASNGADACAGPVPAIACECPCGGGSTPLECTDGRWACGACPLLCIQDAGPPPPSDAGHFACGPDGVTCNANKQYCESASGGAQPLDGGTATTYTCRPLPSDCHGVSSCACVKNSTAGCFCNESSGQVTVTCQYP
jgi:hypothetical protein